MRKTYRENGQPHSREVVKGDSVGREDHKRASKNSLEEANEVRAEGHVDDVGVVAAVRHAVYVLRSESKEVYLYCSKGDERSNEQNWKKLGSSKSRTERKGGGSFYKSGQAQPCRYYATTLL